MNGACVIEERVGQRVNQAESLENILVVRDRLLNVGAEIPAGKGGRE